MAIYHDMWHIVASNIVRAHKQQTCCEVHSVEASMITLAVLTVMVLNMVLGLLLITDLGRPACYDASKNDPCFSCDDTPRRFYLCRTQRLNGRLAEMLVESTCSYIIVGW